MKKIVGLFVLLMLTTACAPEVGSEAWCKDMKAKDGGDWTANETANYTKHCIF